ncbi:MAG: creatininase family protein, partial [Chitinophagaceae bacterium]|nr:creatininase family protein [Chitinophagaceae bacterium]
MPLVYLPLGICEPHGRIAVLGLDLIKAEWLCEEAAQRYGGIVAPALGYQIHESGYHAPWLADVVGNVNAMMTSMPPHVMLHFFLYQLRAFNNAGFKAAIVLSGHAGGNELDFRMAASCFMQYSTMKVKVFADPELVQGKFTGDHAGQYEISQLLYLQEEAVKTKEDDDKNRLGRFALGSDAYT